MFVWCKIFWKIRDCHGIITVKIFFMYWIWKNIQLNKSGVPQMAQNFPGEL